MKDERWIDIKGYEGFYQISNYGRVRSLDRTVYFKNGKGKREYIGKILKQKYHNGYAMVNLNKNKKLEVLYVHRLVALHFIDNPRKVNVVNHIDGVKSNNHWTNLEWVTSSENNSHAVQTGLRNNNVDGLLNYIDTLRKKVVAFKDNRIIAESNCSRDMADFLLKNGYIKDARPETIARAIRKKANDGTSYHNIYFQFC